MTRVTALILNWNGMDCIAACIESVLAQTYPALDIVVVDNASTDGSADVVAGRFPAVRLIRNDSNLGFGGGNNIGIAACDTPYILMLNNDVRIDPQCLARLVAAIDSDPGTGACATKIVLSKMQNRIDAAGIAVCADGMSIGRGRMEPSDRYPTAEAVFFASDCCCLYRKAMLDQIGPYDAEFFAYDEETDLGWRAQRFGWKTLYVPDALAIHDHSASSGSHSPFKAYLVERNRIWLVLQNFPWPVILAGLPCLIRRYFWQAWGALTGAGRAGDFVQDYSKWELIRILLKAYRDALKGVPRAFSRRRQRFKKRAMTSRRIFYLLKRFGLPARDIALKG